MLHLRRGSCCHVVDENLSRAPTHQYTATGRCVIGSAALPHHSAVTQQGPWHGMSPVLPQPAAGSPVFDCQRVSSMVIQRDLSGHETLLPTNSCDDNRHALLCRAMGTNQPEAAASPHMQSPRSGQLVTRMHGCMHALHIQMDCMQAVQAMTAYNDTRVGRCHHPCECCHNHKVKVITSMHGFVIAGSNCAVSHQTACRAAYTQRKHVSKQQQHFFNQANTNKQPSNARNSLAKMLTIFFSWVLLPLVSLHQNASNICIIRLQSFKAESAATGRWLRSSLLTNPALAAFHHASLLQVAAEGLRALLVLFSCSLLSCCV